MAGLLRARLERLACDFPLADNYFAWQAFGRTYDREGRVAVPPYLRRDAYDDVRANAGRVDVLHRSMTDHLAGQPDASLDGFVLLDAQDWMDDDQKRALWAEITRCARPGARAIFRTAGEESAIAGIMPPEIEDRWTYERDQSAAYTRRDRSSIYGGFHLYVTKD